MSLEVIDPPNPLCQEGRSLAGLTEARKVTQQGGGKGEMNKKKEGFRVQKDAVKENKGKKRKF